MHFLSVIGVDFISFISIQHTEQLLINCYSFVLTCR